MKAGILLPQAGDYATRENILYVAKEAEKEGLNSVWVLERLLWPLKPKTPYPGTPDGTLPVEYQNVLDPLETLTYLAGNTDQISLGTCLIDMLFHNPVVLARRFATLDILSHGRAIAGLGIGWSKVTSCYRHHFIFFCCRIFCSLRRNITLEVYLILFSNRRALILG